MRHLHDNCVACCEYCAESTYGVIKASLYLFVCLFIYLEYKNLSTCSYTHANDFESELQFETKFCVKLWACSRHTDRLLSLYYIILMIMYSYHRFE